jgi:hypothetical protein
MEGPMAGAAYGDEIPEPVLSSINVIFYMMDGEIHAMSAAGNSALMHVPGEDLPPECDGDRAAKPRAMSCGILRRWSGALEALICSEKHHIVRL